MGSDLRAVALMNLGTAETRTLELPDAPGAERHLWEGGEVGVYSPILRSSPVRMASSACHAPGERR